MERVIENWRATKKGTPQAIVKKLAQTIQKTLSDKKVQEALTARGAQPVLSTPEEFTQFVASEEKKWGELVKSSRTSLD